MSIRFNALKQRVAALAGTVALTAAALLAGAGAAAAAETTGPGNIDFGTTGSITVHKHEQPAVTGQPGDGSDQGVLDNPLAGVEFTVQQLDIDLSNPANWDGLKNIDPKAPGATKGAPVTLTTDAQGIATFSNLPVGVYVVTEGNAPVELGIVGKAAPFLVVIPTAIEGEWTYDVHAYPKNSVSKLEKTLDADADAAAYGQGDTVTWNIKSTAPTLADGDSFTKFQVVDSLDARLQYVSVENVMYAGVALDAADYTVTVSGQDVTVALTDAGLAKVKANSGKELTFDINTIVVGDIQDGVIPNEATQLTNVNNQETEVDSNSAETYWGYINVLKQDKDNQKKLAGAEFQVFATAEDAAAGTNPIAVNGVDTFVTDANGEVKIGALNVGAEMERTYWIKETKAPAGYVLDETVREVTVVAGQNADVINTIDNKKQDRPALPLTGATGTMLFVAGGAALVALALGVAARQRRARA